MPGTWTWQLCDTNGDGLAELSTAAGRQITYQRNSPSEAQFTISHEDDAASLLLGSLYSKGVPQLKCYRRGPNDSAATLRFRGWLVAIEEEIEETALLTASFRSPFATLYGNGNDTGRFLYSATTYTATDAGLIAKALIDSTNNYINRAGNPTGLGTDSALIALTKPRDRTYPLGTNIGSAIVDLTNVLDGFDFYETFIDGAGQTLAMFNVVSSQGQDLPAVKFEYGPQTLNNVRSASRTISTPTNAPLVLGGNGLLSQWTGNNIGVKYNRWETKAEFTDVVEQATLDDKAKGLTRDNPVKTITFQPEYRLSPLPFDDFNLGDIVRFYARRGAFTEATTGLNSPTQPTPVRINGFTVTIDENGFETAEIDDPISPDQEATIRANLLTEIV